MLADRQQLDMRDPQLRDVGHELRRQLAVGEIAEFLFRPAPPRSQMHLVNGDRRLGAVDATARLHPAFVTRRRARRRAGDRGGPRRRLRMEGERIRLERQQIPLAAQDLVLVALAGAEAGDEYLPPTALAAQPHRVAPPVPAVEIADDADPAGAGRPPREAEAADPA